MLPGVQQSPVAAGGAAQRAGVAAGGAAQPAGVPVHPAAKVVTQEDLPNVPLSRTIVSKKQASTAPQVAEAVFCYGNGSYGKLPPFEARYDGSRPNKSFEHVQGDWRTEDLLMHAPVASQSYLGLSLTLPWKSA